MQAQVDQDHPKVAAKYAGSLRAGLIDAIPDAVLRGLEKRTFAVSPIKGRGSALPDGSIGRFGWKGQISSLDTFVRAAVRNQLGLEVPGHHQASFASPARKLPPM